MRKNGRQLKGICMAAAALLCITGCGQVSASSAETEMESSMTEADNGGAEESALTEETEAAALAETDLKSSEGLEFKSNGDGTCTITGIGTCTDTDIVIPTESPNGDTVTLIKEYAFSSLEDVDSITLLNYDYEVDKHAFQYGEFTELNVIGGSPVIAASAFSSCEDLTLVIFRDCSIELGEYALFSCGKDASVLFENCSGYIDKRAFQYGDLVSLTVRACELEIDDSAFSTCEALTSVVFEDSTIEMGEYAFFTCGDSAVVEMSGCSVVMDDRAFQYSSLSSLTITGEKAEMGDSVFSHCEDLTSVSIDCASVVMGEYAFTGCEDLVSLSICDNGNEDNEIELDDRVFQYCEELQTVVIGAGSITIGEYVFSDCEENLIVSVAGNQYTPGALKEGFSQ